jgi:AraC-like DNA-binding protein
MRMSASRLRVDRPLTERVAAGAAPATTLPASDLRIFLKALRDLGYNPEALLAAAGLRDQDLAHPDARVSCELYGTILGRAQQERFTPNLGLALARVTPLGAWPLLDYLVLTADTVGAGVHQLTRYLRLTGSPVTLRLRDDGDPIRIEIASAVSPLAAEFQVAIMHFHFHKELAERFVADGISFQHRPDDPNAFERTFGCPIACNATWSGTTLSPAVWHLPLPRRDPLLREMLEQHANALLDRLPNRTGVSLEVQRELIARVSGGDTRVSAVARQLKMSARTLQRRLAEEGSSYQQLLDLARKEAASRYLTESTLAIGEVAYLVGFSEPAPFHRAFKRWFGVTPERFRHQRREIPSASA